MDSVRLGMGLVVLGLLVAVPNALATTAADFYAGIPVKAITNEHGYMLIDVKTNQTILYFNHTAINENLDDKPAITKDEAVKIAKELCGEAYTLVRVTENPYDYDLQFERQINGIAVFGEDCYIVINRMTGKVAAFRRMPVEEVKVEPVVKVKKEEALKIAKARVAKLYIVPGFGAVWFTDRYAVDAASGKILSDEMKRFMEEKYRTTVDFGKLERGVEVEVKSEVSSKGVNNDQGAVFRADDDMCKDDIDAAESPYSYWCPWSSWDDDADDYDVVSSENTVNDILGHFEAVYYSGHGTSSGTCIVLREKANLFYCGSDIANNRQTRLFVISACYAGGNSFGDMLVQKGVQCVIGASGEITDIQYWWGYSACADWAGRFWDWATGNVNVPYKKTAHKARIAANTGVWYKDCNLDSEKGNCDIYI